MRTKLRSKIVAVLSTAVIALGMVSVTAISASAHTPKVTPTCSTLSVNLENYDGDYTNTVKVTIDDNVVDTNLDFGGSFKETYAFSDKTVAHTWKVEYTAGDQNKKPDADWTGSQSGTTTACVSHDNPKVPFCHAKPADTAANGWNMPPAADPGIIFRAGHASNHDADIIPAFDYWTKSHSVWTLNHYAGKNLTRVWGGATGAEILANGCEIPDLKDATAVISTTAATCSTAEMLVLVAPANATWGTPTRTTGPGGYSVTATVVDGHTFSNGSKTKVFGGTLDGILSSTNAQCSPPPCLTNEAVSYSYNSATNSGQITVTAKDGHSDTLCNPFWVTAASWTFDGNTHWPQTLDQWIPANSGQKIDSVGTYDYAATVGCGQGDIYATFTSPGVIKPNPELLNGPSNPYKEHFLHEMGFSTSTPGSTYMNRDAGACNPDVVETVPVASFSDVCGTSSDTYNMPSDTAEIDYSVTDSRVNGVGTVTVTAAPKASYVFADGAYPKDGWSHTFTSEDCVATFGDPTVHDQTCSQEEPDAKVSGYIWVDLGGNLDNEISYQIVGGSYDFTASQEINNLTPGDYTVTVTAKDGYKLATDRETVWNFTIGAAATCSLVTHPLISTTATMKNLTCSSGGSYTLADTEGVLWYVNGSKTPTAPGTYSVKDATTVNVQAETDGPDFGWEDNAQTSWTFNFTNPVDCLPTLAYTGSDSGMLGLLLAGGFLLFGGTIVAFERRFRANAK